MRFIRKEHIITTICNEEIKEKEDIKQICENIKKNRVEFSLTIKKYFSSDYDSTNIQYKNVRIKNVNEETVDLIICGKSLTFLNNILFSDIVELSAITTINKIYDKKVNPTRFDFLDIKEE